MTDGERGRAIASALLNGGACMLAGRDKDGCELLDKAVELFAGDQAFAADNLVDVDRMIDGLACFSRECADVRPLLERAIALRLRIIGEPV